MGIVPILLRRWQSRASEKAEQWLFQTGTNRGIRSYHLWLITALIVLGIFTYYVDQTALAYIPPFNHSFFTGVHDLHRTLFFIPIIYAALVFRVRGSLATSFVFLCVILPRALLFSPYPNPLLRSLIFIISAALVSLLVATQLNRIEKERKSQAELNAAYQKLSEYDKNLRANQEQLIRTEKLTSLGQMAGSFAHEINNPLGGVLVYTQLLAKRIASDSIRKEEAIAYLSKMEIALTHSTRLIKRLLDFARGFPATVSEVNINHIINQAITLASHAAEQQHIQIVKEFAPHLPAIMADLGKLQQVFTSIVMNAIEAMPEGGKLTVTTSDDSGNLKILVKDTGHGISPENMTKIFTPFFTTKKEVKGVGLSLAVAHGIIESHQGRIEVQSKEGEGTTFAIYLPLQVYKP